MSRRPRLSVVVLLVLLAGSAWHASFAQEPEPSAVIRDLTVWERDGLVKASFRLEGSFTPAVMEKLAGASNIRFSHTVRVFRRRAAWFARLLAVRRVETTAQYDNLTRHYSMTRRLDGRTVAQTQTESFEEMRRFMTEVEELTLASLEELAGERQLTVKVRSEYEDTWLLFLFPWSYAAVSQRDFTVPR